MSAADMINGLGGTLATARIFRVGESAVSNWRRRGFPKSRELEGRRWCRKFGIAYDPTPTEIDVRDTTHGGTSSTRSSNTKTHIEGQHGKQMIKECDRNVAERVLSDNLANSDRDTAAANASDDAAQQPQGCGGSDEEGAAA